VESGTYRGFTANRLAQLFPNCSVVTFETNREHWKKAKKRCNPRINAIWGSLDEKLLTKKTAVLIDGPKGKKAIELAQQIIDKVAFVAIHDMKNFIPVLKKKFGEVVHSGKPDKAMKKLDKYIPYKSSHHGKYYGQVLAIVRSKNGKDN
jgi:hypothetical protein